MDDRAEIQSDATLEMDVAQPDSHARRRLLSALMAGGLAAVTAPSLLGRASAATDGSPEHRSAADNARLNAAFEHETRMTATYKAAVGATTDQEFQAAFLLVHDHHLAYAQALKGYLGTDARTPGNTSPLATVQGTTAAMSGALAALEESTVSLHLSTLAQLKGIDAASLLASIVSTEARHAAALALVSGKNPAAVAGN